MLDKEVTLQLIRLNLIIFGLLLGVSYGTFLVISGRSPIKRVTSKTIVWIIKGFIILLPITTFFFLNYPLLIDTLQKNYTEKIARVKRVRFFPPGLWFVSQDILIDGVSYRLILNRQIILNEKIYRLFYLPKTRFILKIEEVKQ